jgi:mono/diheme cytochrome c family protein
MTRALAVRSWLRHPVRAVLLGLAVGVVGTLVVEAVVVGPLALNHRQDLPLEQEFGSFAVSLTSRLHAGSQKNPVAQNARALQSGRYAYTGSCAQCHGATGNGKGAAFSVALYPPATDLTSEHVKEKSDAELFWITKHGLSFTGMPAFGDQYSDADIWAMVSYVRSLQTTSAPAAWTVVPGR